MQCVMCVMKRSKIAAPLAAIQVFLWPIGLILLCMPFSLLGGFNPTRFVLGIYFG